jgi:hypothetical protein
MRFSGDGVEICGSNSRKVILQRTEELGTQNSDVLVNAAHIS